MTPTVIPEQLTAALDRMLSAEIRWKPADGGVCVDTPYQVASGYGLRAYFTSGDGHIRVSDGGFATSQVEMGVHHPAALRPRYKELERIASSLGLEWNGEFSYLARDTEDAVKRLKVLAQAVQEGQALAVVRSTGRGRDVVQALAARLTRTGAEAVVGAKIQLPERQRPIVVDLRVERERRSAVVEVLAGRSASGAAIQVDRAVTNFHALANAHYPARLYGVFEERSPAAEARFRERFESAKPSDAVLVSSAEAADVIEQALAA